MSGFISIQIITVLVTWRKAYANETCCTKGGNPIWQKKQEPSKSCLTTSAFFLMHTFYLCITNFVF